MCKKLLTVLLCIVLLSSTACAARITENPLPTSGPQETTTLPPEDGSQTTGTSETVGTTTPTPVPEPILPEVILPEKRTFDKEAVYRHVFEEHSVKIPKDEVEALDVDYQNREALISYYTRIDENGLPVEADYYLVQGFDTYSSGHVSKYSVMLASLLTARYMGPVSHDYHEAYLDVLFEHLTFSPCEKLPSWSEAPVCTVGTISFDGKTYTAVSDGYLYSSEKDEEGNTSYLRCDQTVDIAYLTCIMLGAAIYDGNQDEIERNSFNQFAEADPSYTVRTVQNEDGEEITYYLDADGTAYRIFEPGWHFIPLADGMGKSALFWWAQKTFVYPCAEANGLFD